MNFDNIKDIKELIPDKFLAILGDDLMDIQDGGGKRKFTEMEEEELDDDFLEKELLKVENDHILSMFNEFKEEVALSGLTFDNKEDEARIEDMFNKDKYNSLKKIEINSIPVHIVKSFPNSILYVINPILVIDENIEKYIGDVNRVDTRIGNRYKNHDHLTERLENERFMRKRNLLSTVVNLDKRNNFVDNPDKVEEEVERILSMMVVKSDIGIKKSTVQQKMPRKRTRTNRPKPGSLDNVLSGILSRTKEVNKNLKYKPFKPQKRIEDEDEVGIYDMVRQKITFKTILKKAELFEEIKYTVLRLTKDMKDSSDEYPKSMMKYLLDIINRRGPMYLIHEAIWGNYILLEDKKFNETLMKTISKKFVNMIKNEDVRDILYKVLINNYSDRMKEKMEEEMKHLIEINSQTQGDDSALEETMGKYNDYIVNKTGVIYIIHEILINGKFQDPGFVQSKIPSRVRDYLTNSQVNEIIEYKRSKISFMNPNMTKMITFRENNQSIEVDEETFEEIENQLNNLRFVNEEDLDNVSMNDNEIKFDSVTDYLITSKTGLSRGQQIKEEIFQIQKQKLLTNKKSLLNLNPDDFTLNKVDTILKEFNENKTEEVVEEDSLDDLTQQLNNMLFEETEDNFEDLISSFEGLKTGESMEEVSKEDNLKSSYDYMKDRLNQEKDFFDDNVFDKLERKPMMSRSDYLNMLKVLKYMDSDKHPGKKFLYSSLSFLVSRLEGGNKRNMMLLDEILSMPQNTRKLVEKILTLDWQTLTKLDFDDQYLNMIDKEKKKFIKEAIVFINMMSSDNIDLEDKNHTKIFKRYLSMIKETLEKIDFSVGLEGTNKEELFKHILSVLNPKQKNDIEESLDKFIIQNYNVDKYDISSIAFDITDKKLSDKLLKVVSGEDYIYDNRNLLKTMSKLVGVQLYDNERVEKIKQDISNGVNVEENQKLLNFIQSLSKMDMNPQEYMEIVQKNYDMDKVMKMGQKWMMDMGKKYVMKTRKKLYTQVPLAFFFNSVDYMNFLKEENKEIVKIIDIIFNMYHFRKKKDSVQYLNEYVRGQFLKEIGTKMMKYQEDNIKEIYNLLNKISVISKLPRKYTKNFIDYTSIAVFTEDKTFKSKEEITKMRDSIKEVYEKKKTVYDLLKNGIFSDGGRLLLILLQGEKFYNNVIEIIYDWFRLYENKMNKLLFVLNEKINHVTNEDNEMDILEELEL